MNKIKKSDVEVAQGYLILFAIIVLLVGFAFTVFVIEENPDGKLAQIVELVMVVLTAIVTLLMVMGLMALAVGALYALILLLRARLFGVVDDNKPENENA